MLTRTTHHLGDFDHDARELDVTCFRAQHGEAFFVHYGALSGFANPLCSTVVTSALSLRGPAPWHYDYFVFPLRKPALTGNAADDVVRIGRAADNDVMIPDPSLSKAHAYLVRRPSGLWTIEDAGSTNGTRVNGAAIPIRGQGIPTPLQPGARVVMGVVELTFLMASEFCALVKRLGPIA